MGVIWLSGAALYLLLDAVVCRCCGVGRSFRAVRCGFTGGCIVLLCVLESGCSLAALTEFVFLGMLMVVARVDLATMKIPDRFVLILFLIGLVSVGTMPGMGLAERLAGMVSASLLLALITWAVPGAFGGGDIKLMCACGLLLGWKNSLVSLFLAILTGGLYGCYLLLSGKKNRKDHFAFGPFLCLGMLCALFWGEELLCWYLELCRIGVC